MASKLGTAFDIIELLDGPDAQRLSVGEVAERLGIAKSTASTTCQALADEGYLMRLGTGGALRYAMGPRFHQAFSNAIARECARLEAGVQRLGGEARIVTEPLRRLAAALADDNGGRTRGSAPTNNGGAIPAAGECSVAGLGSPLQDHGSGS